MKTDYAALLIDMATFKIPDGAKSQIKDKWQKPINIIEIFGMICLSVYACGKINIDIRSMFSESFNVAISNLFSPEFFMFIVFVFIAFILYSIIYELFIIEIFYKSIELLSLTYKVFFIFLYDLPIWAIKRYLLKRKTNFKKDYLDNSDFNKGLIEFYNNTTKYSSQVNFVSILEDLSKDHNILRFFERASRFIFIIMIILYLYKINDILTIVFLCLFIVVILIAYFFDKIKINLNLYRELKASLTVKIEETDRLTKELNAAFDEMYNNIENETLSQEEISPNEEKAKQNEK